MKNFISLLAVAIVSSVSTNAFADWNCTRIGGTANWGEPGDSFTIASIDETKIVVSDMNFKNGPFGNGTSVRAKNADGEPKFVKDTKLETVDGKPRRVPTGKFYMDYTADSEDDILVISDFLSEGGGVVKLRAVPGDGGEDDNFFQCDSK